MPTAPVPIPAIPTPVPSSADPTNFDARADAMMAAFPAAVDGVNDAAQVTYGNAVEAMDAAADAVSAYAAALIAAAAAVGGGGYTAILTDNINTANGVKNLATGLVGKLFANTSRVTLIRLSDETVRMRGNVSLANMGAGTMTVTVDEQTAVVGPFNDWIVILTLMEPLPAATDNQVTARTGRAAVTPENLDRLMEEVTSIALAL